MLIIQVTQALKFYHLWLLFLLHLPESFTNIHLKFVFSFKSIIKKIHFILFKNSILLISSLLECPLTTLLA